MLHSLVFFSLLGSMIAANVFWWRHADRLASRLPRPTVWRRVILAWSGVMAFVMLLIILSRAISGRIIDWVPQPIVAAVYLWHVLFALEWLVWRAVYVPIRAGLRRMRSRRTPQLNAADSSDQSDPRLPSRREVPSQPESPLAPLSLSSRRQFLTAAAITAPPLFASLAAWRAVSQIDHFRTNTVTLRIPNLPPALEGLRIAHVSDIHIGTFTDDPLLKAVVERTNALRPDLILFTGDLIDWDPADLPAGLDILQKWDPKFGLCVCEGNHDIIAGRWKFESQMKKSGFPMPINSSHSVTVRGQEIQLLGMRWGNNDLSDQRIGEADSDIAHSVRDLIPQIKPGAFPILMAHHPHAFDYLGDANLPLTLSGHTHGGQINLGPIHPASLRFRYLSGLYTRPDGKQLFVSNGVGNWFPLRINAPAEIGDITLRGI